MTGGSEKAAGKKDGGPTLTAQVPVGWQRKVEDGAVAYISPSGTVLCSVEEVRVYLLTDGTCKCGLECPLVLHKVFNFDPTAGVHAQSHQSGKVEEDMTKLCNHRRKVVAMAALCRSMQASQVPLSAHGSGTGVCTVDGKERRGSIVARGDVPQRTYTTQLTLNQARNSSSGSFPVLSPLCLLQNGSVPHTTAILTPDPSSPLKKVSSQSPGPSVAAYGKQQWSPRPALPQTILQRAPQKSTSPSTTKVDAAHSHQTDPLVPVTLSSPPSSSSPVIARVGQAHIQGLVVKSSPPLSLCSSPSRAQDTFSPHQRSRHSSTSSLSEGASGSMLTQGVKSSPSPLPPAQPCSSPKLSAPPASQHSRLEGILQHYKDCSTNNPDATQQHHSFSSRNKLHTLQNPQSVQSNPCDKRNGPVLGTAPGLIGLPLGQILCQQKSQQHISSSFPASSLLSAAAKAQLASQKNQSQSRAVETGSLPLPALDKEQQSKVLISTLNTSLNTPTAPTQSLTAFLLPHSPTLPVSNPAQSEKRIRRKRQRRSPTVLSMLKESQVNRTVGHPVVSSPAVPSSSFSSSSSPPPVTRTENHHQPTARPSSTPPSTTPVPISVLKQVELEEGKRVALSNSLPLCSPPVSSQPLSALLQLLSMQSAQNNSPPTIPPSRHTIVSPSSPPIVTSQAPQYDTQLGPQTHIHIKQSQPQNLVPALDSLNQLETAQPLSLTCEDAEAVAVNLKTANTVLNLSLPHTSNSKGTEPAISSHTHDVINQLSSATCLSASTVSEKPCASKQGGMGSDHNIYQTNQPDQNQASDSDGPVMSEEQQNLATKLLPGCDPDSNLSLANPPGTSSADLSNSDPTSTLQLAESFPFMTQEQLLQLLSSNAALPSLLPPFLGSLPLGLWAGTQTPTTGGTQTPQPANNLLSQASPLNVLPSSLGPQGDLPLNLVSVLNPPHPGPPLAPSVATGLETGEKNPGLQALLMASLLLGQNPATMLPFPGLNLDLPPLQQVFGEGVTLEKTPTLLDSVLMGPGLLDALQALAPSSDGQSLLLSAQLTPPPPPPPTFLSLNPALLAAALAQAETLPNHTPSPPPNTQGTLSSPALVSTSVSCTPLVPVTGQEACDSLTEQEKTNTQTPQFLPTILPQGVLGDLAALGNINSLHGLLAAGPLLLSQAPSLGMPLPQNQAALNPLTCLQLSMGPTLMGEKPLAVHETTSAQENLPTSQLCQDSLLNPGHLQTPTQQREEPAGAASGLIDPYGSFMDTIYTSFLQVSGRSSEGGSDSTPLSYPELAPSLSPRRACSVHNPDLSRLSMEAAQSPARGTPKLSEDPPTTPPCKPAESHSPDAPIHLTFMEEAKTDGSAKLCVYSNGIGTGARRDDDDDDGGEEERRQAPMYLGPRERVNIVPVDDMMENVDTEQGRALEIRTGARRGRKRKQTLQRGAEFSGDIEHIIEEPAATIALQRPARGKRRRVVR